MRIAFRLSLPILGAYWFLGITYGILASSMDYPLWVPLLMAMIVYSGSVEFLALTILSGTFDPMGSMAIAVMVGARHLFYGVSMLEKYSGSGWRKPLLIFWMADEAFAINYSFQGTHAQYLWLSFLNYCYWITGTVMGYLFGAEASESLMTYFEGLDFVITAMFVAIFMDDYIRNKETHASAWLGIGASSICLALFGPKHFIVPSMICIIIAQYVNYRRESIWHNITR